MKISHFLFSSCLTLAVAGVSAQPLEYSPPSLPDSISLDAALRYAKDNNLSIREAKYAVEESDSRIVQTKSRDLPTVTVSGNYLRQDEELSPYIPASGDSWGGSVEAVQTLYSGGSVKADQEAAMSSQKASIASLDAITQDALLQVRLNFLNVLLAKELVKVQKENVELLQYQLEDVKKRFESGVVSRFEVLRAEVALANAQPDLISARNQLRLSKDDLIFTLGADPAEEVDYSVQGILKFTDVDYQIRNCIRQAIDKRSELQSLEYRAEASKSQIDSARSGYRPTVKLHGGWLFQRDGSRGSLEAADNGWQAGVRVNWNIFDGKATQGAVLEKMAQYRQVQVQQRIQQNSIALQVRSSFNDLQEAKELVVAARKVVEQAEESLRLAQSRYKAGTTTQLDLFDAQVALTQAKTNKAQALYRYQTSIANLERSMGVRL